METQESASVHTWKETPDLEIGGLSEDSRFDCLHLEGTDDAWQDLEFPDMDMDNRVPFEIKSYPS